MSCDRFEREGLALLEAGQALPEHFTHCPDCLAARERYRELGSALREAGAELEPAGDWQARVWARVRQREAVREKPGRRFGLLWLPALAAAGLTAALALPSWLRPKPGLTLEVAPAGAVRRGGEAHPGDRLQLRAHLGEAAFAELRLYRNDHELVLACADEPPCERHGDRLEAQLPLPAVGRYQTLLIFSGSPLPALPGSYDGDAGAALAAGARVIEGRELEVQ